VELLFPLMISTKTQFIEAVMSLPSGVLFPVKHRPDSIQKRSRDYSIVSPGTLSVFPTMVSGGSFSLYVYESKGHPESPYVYLMEPSPELINGAPASGVKKQQDRTYRPEDCVAFASGASGAGFHCIGGKTRANISAANQQYSYICELL
jgi:hypothetical protein